MLPTNSPRVSQPIGTVSRARVWYVLVMFIIGVFLVRLFYLQIIRHEYYQHSAQVGHLKEYEIPASRGVIEAYSGDSVVPITLNQALYTLYADPTLVKDAPHVASVLHDLIPAVTSDVYEKKLTQKDTRYVVLARKITKEQKSTILKKEFPGIGTQEQQYRTYPNGSLAAQLLGFVNDEGKGVYGIEQALNKQLAGKPGQLKAVTDVRGVPLAANTNNILNQPVSGKDVVLTIDISMQRQLENILKSGLDAAKSPSGSALILEANTGAVKAMANWPTYDPAQYNAVDDASVFANAAVSSPLEVGSVMKPLTLAAALDQRAVNPDTTYYDPASYKIDGYTVKNIEEDGGPGQKSMAQLLNLSLNTGATWLLMRMGNSNDQITQKGREAWYNYMTKHYLFGTQTGIEQGYEADGSVPDPNKGYGRNLTYANTAFGQAMTATTLQMAGAYAAMLNGGNYYRPRLVDYTVDDAGHKTSNTPQILQRNVVSSSVSNAVQPLLEFVVNNHSFKRKFDQQTYSVGGKTGTAQIASPDGGYLPNDYNGTYMGFVGGDTPQYIIAVRANTPKIPGYAGSAAAQPIFGDLAHMLLDNFNVTPKKR